MGLKFRFSKSEGILRSVDESPGIVAPLATMEGFGIAISPSINLVPGEHSVVGLPDDELDQMTQVGAAEAVEACVDEAALGYLKFVLPRAALIAADGYRRAPEGLALLDGMIEFLEEFKEAAT